MPQHHHEAALLDAEAHAPQRRLAPLALLRRIGEGQVLCFDHGHILRSLFNRSQMAWLTFSICHRHAQHHGPAHRLSVPPQLHHPQRLSQ